jgi:hypothetical protein
MHAMVQPALETECVTVAGVRRVCPSPQVGVVFSDRTHFFCDRTQKLTRQIDVESLTSQMPSRKACGR